MKHIPCVAREIEKYSQISDEILKNRATKYENNKLLQKLKLKTMKTKSEKTRRGLAKQSLSKKAIDHLLFGVGVDTTNRLDSFLGIAPRLKDKSYWYALGLAINF